MKPLILLCSVFLLITQSVFSQEILGKLKLQDAEMSMKASKWDEALEHIKEAEKFFAKPQPTAVWMKIQIFDKQIDQQASWKLWQQLRDQFNIFEQHCKDDDRLPQVQKLKEKYSRYPSSEADWAAFVQKPSTSTNTTVTVKNEESQSANRDGPVKETGNTASSAGTAKVYFLRSTGFGGSANPFTLFVNTKFVSMLSNKRYVLQELPAGEHFFASQVDGKTLKERTVSHSYILEPGKTYYLKVYFIPDKGLRVQVVFLKVNDAEGQKMLAELKEQK